MLRGDADFCARANLVSHVNRRRGIVANYHRRKSRRDVSLPLKGCNCGCDFPLNRVCRNATIQQFSAKSSLGDHRGHRNTEIWSAAAERNGHAALDSDRNFLPSLIHSAVATALCRRTPKSASLIGPAATARAPDTSLAAPKTFHL